MRFPITRQRCAQALLQWKSLFVSTSSGRPFPRGRTDMVGESVSAWSLQDSSGQMVGSGGMLVLTMWRLLSWEITWVFLNELLSHEQLLRLFVDKLPLTLFTLLTRWAPGFQARLSLSGPARPPHSIPVQNWFFFPLLINNYLLQREFRLFDYLWFRETIFIWVPKSFRCFHKDLQTACLLVITAEWHRKTWSTTPDLQ